MEDTTWIKIYRKFLEWEWYDDVNTKSLFLHILLKANYKDNMWHGTLVKRGSFITSLDTLFYELNKNPKTKRLRKTGMITKMNIRTAIKHLILTKEITKVSTPEYTVITINNYDDYQTPNKAPNKALTKHQQTSNKPLTTTKESKEGIERKENKNNSLKLLKDSELWEELSLKFNVNRSYIENECEKMEDWLKSKGKRQSDYRAFARNWIRRAMENNKDDKGFERRDAMLESTRNLLNQYKK